MKCRFAGLPPEALQWRDDIFKEALHFVIGLAAHFQCVRNRIQHADGLLVGAARLVGVAASSDSDIVCLRHGYDLRPVLRHIEFLVFFLEVKGHGFLSVLCF